MKTQLLMRISSAITPAAQTQADDEPTAFTETMRIDVNDPNDPALLRFYCTDGFRMHMVEYAPKDATILKNFEPMVFGVVHLHQALENHAGDEITLDGVYDHSWWTTTIGEHEGKYQIPVWPDVDKLLGEDAASPDAAVGFNVEYFAEFMEAAIRWADKDAEDRTDEDETFPLRVLQMRTKGACHFTLDNSDGMFRAILMPVVLRW